MPPAPHQPWFRMGSLVRCKQPMANARLLCMHHVICRPQLAEQPVADCHCAVSARLSLRKLLLKHPCRLRCRSSCTGTPATGRAAGRTRARCTAPRGRVPATAARPTAARGTARGTAARHTPVTGAQGACPLPEVCQRCAYAFCLIPSDRHGSRHGGSAYSMSRHGSQRTAHTGDRSAQADVMQWCVPLSKYSQPRSAPAATVRGPRCSCCERLQPISARVAASAAGRA